MEKQIKKVLEELEKNNYQAYLVGGYVRDYLLGEKSFDIDICTNCLPKDIHQIFKCSKSNYGCVNFKLNKYNIDITTFRKDLNYVNRKPSQVIYINSLEEDLLRRDFTINAICMNKNGRIIDILGGINDLNNRLIKMIGNVNEKVQEDPLRILRAIRFATVLNFELDQNLYDTIKKYSYLVASLSKERIKSELDKILLSKNFNYGLNLIKEFNLDEIIGLQYDNVFFVDDLLGMWAQIKVLDMPFTNLEKSNIIKIAEIIKYGKVDNLMLYKYGLYLSLIAGKILNLNIKDINKKYNKLPIKSRSDIDINVKDLGVGKEINVKYIELENNILTNRLKNKNKDIKKFLERK